MVEKTFMKITNKDIYDEIKKSQKINEEQHQQILLHQKETNGKVGANRWMITTVITVGIALIALLAALKW